MAAVASVLAGWALARPAPSAPVSRYSIALRADGGLAPILDARLALTPDGRTFVYSGVRAEGGVQLWMRPRDQLVATPLPGTEGGYNPAVSPDGSRVAFVSESTGTRRLMVASLGGAPPLVVEDSLVDAGGVSWGFDGYIYYDGHL
jgi:Tol biopolymer transport system component